MFSSEFCERLSKNIFFYRTPPLAAPVEACNFIKIRIRHGWFFEDFLTISKNVFFDALQEYSRSSQKYWRKNVCKISLCGWLFRKNNNTINCDHNDDAICFLILGRLLWLGSLWNKISLEVLERSICVAHGLTKLLRTMTLIRLNYINSFWLLRKCTKTCFCMRKFINVNKT